MILLEIDVNKKAKEARKVYIRLAEAYVFRWKIVDINYEEKRMRTMLAERDGLGYHPGSVVIGYVKHFLNLQSY